MAKKRDIRKELETYPVYKLENAILTQIEPPDQWQNVVLHHYVRRQQFDSNPERFSKIQKIIFLTPECHADAHSYNRRFKEKYKIELNEIIYRGK